MSNNESWCVPDCAANLDRGAWCGEKHPEFPEWVCSRSKGHNGPHIGCYIHPRRATDHKRFIWGKEDLRDVRW